VSGIPDASPGSRRPEDPAEAKFRRLADSAPVMVWMAGVDALCTWFNQAWLEFRGRELADELGNGWTEGIHPDDRELYLGAYLKAFSARQRFRVRFRLRRSDGEYRWVDAAGAPSYDGDGAFDGFLGSAFDTTQQKRLPWTPDENAMRAIFLLTERERQVLSLIADGLSTREAALKLGISYKTADSHRSRILEKLNVHETASMVRIAIRAGLIEP
jgi:PAS domain S-box-containing protein